MTSLDIVATVMMLFAPLAAYLQTIGAGQTKPKPTGLLAKRKYRWIIDKRWIIVGVNGLFFCAAYLIYRFVGLTWALVTMLFSLPTLLAQFILVMEARMHFIKK